MKTSSRTAVATALFACSLACSVPATAREPVSRSETVTFADLDLATENGNAALYARLRAASLRVCRDVLRDVVAGRADLYSCVHDALHDAVESVDRPGLTALHAGNRAVRLTARR